MIHNTHKSPAPAGLFVAVIRERGYNKEKTGGDGMKGYEKFVLALTAGFIALCAAVFLLGIGGQDYTITVTDRAPENVFLTEDVQSDGTPDSLIPGEKIDLNTAPPLELARLPGIGESRARAIADYRDSHGPFETPEDLLQVNGIGEATLEKILEYVVID